MTHSNVSEELLYLRKRARRRLVGAVALVLFALTVLWTVLDSAPPSRFSTGTPVEIVSSAPALTAPRASVVAVVEPGNIASLRPTPDALVAASMPAVEPVPANAPVAAKVAQDSHLANAPAVLPGKLVNRHSVPAKDSPAPTVKPRLKASAPVAVDPKKILEGQVDPTESAAKPAGKYYVQIGAFADMAKAQQLAAKLKAAGLPVLTEKVKSAKGELMRVRVGPAPDAGRAEAYRKKAESVGVSGKVAK